MGVSSVRLWGVGSVGLGVGVLMSRRGPYGDGGALGHFWRSFCVAGSWAVYVRCWGGVYCIFFPFWGCGLYLEGIVVGFLFVGFFLGAVGR